MGTQKIEDVKMIREGKLSPTEIAERIGIII